MWRNPGRRSWWALGAVVALVLTTACSDDPEQADTESVSDATAASSAPVDPVPEVTQPAPAAVRSEPAAAPADPPGEPLATTSVPIGFIEGELEMAVTTLDVTGELLRVAITFTASLPPEAEDVAIGAVLASDESAPAMGISPEVIDPVNLKAYEVVTGAIPNGTAVSLTDAAPRTLVFYFAAPQDDVETVDIVLSSRAAPITDVPFGP